MPQILRQVAAEGVRELHLVSDEPELLEASAEVPAGTVVSHRDGMDALQKTLREKPGVSVIVYAQVRAAEKRRRRKQKKLIDPPKCVLINEELSGILCSCEGDAMTSNDCATGCKDSPRRVARKASICAADRLYKYMPTLWLRSRRRDELEGRRIGSGLRG